MFWQQTKQVALTYVTLRWTWLILGFTLLVTGISYFAPHEEIQETWIALALGFPAIMGMTSVVMIAKWQFANPRARLLPGYAGPHLTVLSTLLLVILVANPVFLSKWGNLSLPGSLAFTLLLGAIFSWAVNPGRILSILPVAVFLSGIPETGKQFWFFTPNRFEALHWTLAAAGGAIVVAWLRRLSNLTEEMDDYQVATQGIGLSRLERTEQRRLLGKLAARSRLVAALVDRWHDRPHADNLTARLQYGFGSVSGELTALFIGVSCAVYGVVLYQLHLLRADMTVPESLWCPVAIAVAIPAAGAGLLLTQRKPRMAHELLRPATRTQYVNGLLKALAKRTALTWLALQLALIAVVRSIDDVLPSENFVPLMAAYFLVSLALQVPAFGLCVGIAHWSSPLLQMLGMYAVAGFDVLAIWAWWIAREPLGNFSAMAIVVVVLLTLGAALIRTARRTWLRAELG